MSVSHKQWLALSPSTRKAMEAVSKLARERGAAGVTCDVRTAPRPARVFMQILFVDEDQQDGHDIFA